MISNKFSIKDYGEGTSGNTVPKDTSKVTTTVTTPTITDTNDTSTTDGTTSAVKTSSVKVNDLNLGTSASDDYWKTVNDKVNNYYDEQQKTSDEYYKELKNANYKDAFENKVALANANELAKKYALNTVKANGYGSQGVAETTNSSLSNNYLNALSKANSNYQDAESTINQNQMSANSTMAANKFSQLLSNMASERSENREDATNFVSSIQDTMSSFSDQSDLDDYLVTTGYLSDDDGDGNYDWNVNKLRNLGLSDQQIAQIASTYASGKINFASNSSSSNSATSGAGTLTQNDDGTFDYSKATPLTADEVLNSQTSTNKDGVNIDYVKDDKWGNKWEFEAVENLIKNATDESVYSNKVFKLINQGGDGNETYLYVDGNGGFYVLSSVQFNKYKGKVVDVKNRTVGDEYTK